AAARRAAEPAKSSGSIPILAPIPGPAPKRNQTKENTTMAGTERRRLSRTAVKGLAYVNLDQDNGGTIVNISEGGLCFQATLPVRSTETIRFWFAAAANQAELSRLRQTSQSERRTGEMLGFVQTNSELMWTDETRRRGGLRFTDLPDESRLAIRTFIKQFSTNESTLSKNSGNRGIYFSSAARPAGHGTAVSSMRQSYKVAERPNSAPAERGAAVVTTF